MSSFNASCHLREHSAGALLASNAKHELGDTDGLAVWYEHVAKPWPIFGLQHQQPESFDILLSISLNTDRVPYWCTPSLSNESSCSVHVPFLIEGDSEYAQRFRQSLLFRPSRKEATSIQLMFASSAYGTISLYAASCVEPTSH